LTCWLRPFLGTISLFYRNAGAKSDRLLGDDKPRKSDFRLVTATNIDDIELRRRLDADFFDRISLLTLVLPPLREVPEELPWLWEAVYKEASWRAGVSASRALMGAPYHRSSVAHLRRHPLSGNLRDLFRVAYRVLAARSESEQPMSPSNAVAYGIDGLGGAPEGGGSQDTLARSVAAAFAHGATIDDLIGKDESIDTRKILAEVKAYIAREVRRISRDRDIKPKDLCDVSDRSLREWERNGLGGRKKSAQIKKKSAE